MFDTPESLFKLVKEGKISTKEFTQRCKGFHIRVAGKRHYSKWSTDQMKEIRKRNGVGRPPAVIKTREAKKIAKS